MVTDSRGEMGPADDPPLAAPLLMVGEPEPRLVLRCRIWNMCSMTCALPHPLQVLVASSESTLYGRGGRGIGEGQRAL